MILALENCDKAGYYMASAPEQTLTQVRKQIEEVYVKNTEQKLAPLTRIRKLIGKRMSVSRKTRPCFYMGLKADVTESPGIKIITNAFYICALARLGRRII